MPSRDGPYHIERELKPGTTWLAVDDTQRRVVLKRLPDDCLRQSQLHPAVRDRLARFRELPLMTFATLIGVERAHGHVVTVSEYVDGVTIHALPPAERARHLKALRHAIAALHHLGLVHGQLHASNVLVDTTGRLQVIDPSPLLHDDPAEDLAALDRLDPPAQSEAIGKADDDAPIRQRTLRAAVVLTVTGAAVVAGLVAFFWNHT